jgi:hypothetical protein
VEYGVRSILINELEMGKMSDSKLALRLQWPCKQWVWLVHQCYVGVACDEATIHMIALTILYTIGVLGVWILKLTQIDKKQVYKSARLKKC